MRPEVNIVPIARYLKEEPERRKMSLLMLVDARRNTMKGTLPLLGIDAMQKM